MSVEEVKSSAVPENLLLSPVPKPDGPTEVLTTAFQDETPYSIYSPRQKVCLSAFAGLLAFLSPLSANCYFPVLPQLSKYYGRPSSSINLTITIYMIFQGIAPMFSGAFADSSGRRPAYLALFIIYLAACVGLAVQSNYIALMLLRCVQSSGCSGMVAIASGVVSDIASRKERGGYMGIVSSGALLGPAIGPIIGGVIGQKAGWRWIFWFLVILGGACGTCLAIFVPETSRKIVGNGSIYPPPINRSLLQILRSRKSRYGEDEKSRSASPEIAKTRFQLANIIFTLKVFREKDIAILLFFYSMIYTAYYCVLSSLPTIFGDIYGYDTLQVGLCFLPIGCGMWLSSMVGGRVLDYHYRAIAKTLPSDMKQEDFPIEAARLRSIWVGVVITISSVICYGWVLHQRTHVAVPLILQLIIGVGVNIVSLATNTLIVDLYPASPSSITAANNLTRCLMGAAGTGLIEPVLHAMGRGWCFTFIGGLCILLTPFLWMETRYGQGWRKEREIRIALSNA